jgi:hypothetical protein
MLAFVVSMGLSFAVLIAGDVNSFVCVSLSLGKREGLARAELVWILRMMISLMSTSPSACSYSFMSVARSNTAVILMHNAKSRR